MINKKTTIAFLALMVLAAPTVALATFHDTVGDDPDSAFSDVGTFTQLLTRIFNFLFGLFMVVASAFLLYAGFLYLNSRGDPGKTENAKHMLLYAVIAVVIAAVAWGLPTAVKTFIQN